VRVTRAMAGVIAGVVLAGAAGVAHGETITATGTGQARVLAAPPLSNAKITRAVTVARKLAVADAFEAALNQATRFAIVGGFNLGAIQAIEEPAGSPYGYFGGGPFTTGRFGPGQYCGKITQVRRAPRVNRRRGPIISQRQVTRCFKPPFVSVTVSVTYDATPIAIAPAT
jgi:hypothetical protein